MSEQVYPIITLTSETAVKYGIGCLKNPKHPGFAPKVEWLRDMMAKGLTIKQVLNSEKSVGFIEYVPGEYSWRTVKADGYMVIHCLWVYPKVYQQQGLGAMLVRSCIDDARERGCKGVAVVTSEGSWIAGQSLFLKQEFEIVDSKGRFDLMVHKFGEHDDGPGFVDECEQDYIGLHVLVTDQCPMCHKFINDIKGYCRDNKIPVNIHKIETAELAQCMPSPFGTFAIVHDNMVVADHPVSLTRFKNIIHKELKL